jgi:hypothetical protein
MDIKAKYEHELHNLRGEISDVRTESREQLAGIKADVAVLAKAQGNTNELLNRLDGKLDEQRTKRPDLVAITGALVSLVGLGLIMLGGMWTLFQAQLEPITQLQQIHEDRLEKIRESRWSRDDMQRYSDSHERVHDRNDQQHLRMDERIRDLEKKQ